MNFFIISIIITFISFSIYGKPPKISIEIKEGIWKVNDIAVLNCNGQSSVKCVMDTMKNGLTPVDINKAKENINNTIPINNNISLKLKRFMDKNNKPDYSLVYIHTFTKNSMTQKKEIPLYWSSCGQFPVLLSEINAPSKTTSSILQRVSSLFNRNTNKCNNDVGQKTTATIISKPIDVERCFNFITNCMSIIEEHIDTEGLYRLSGTSLKTNSIFENFASSDDSKCNFSNDDDIHNITGVIKKIVREDKCIDFKFNSLNQYKQYPKNDESDPISSEYLNKITTNLELNQQKILCHILAHLNKISKNHKVNSMTDNNLSIVFSPNFVSITPTESFMDRSSKFEAIFKELIVHYNELNVCKTN